MRKNYGKEFNRNICFTFFEDFRKTAKEIEADFGKESVADYYNAIIDYALYANEPELKGVIKYIWHTTKTSIDKSIERRSNGFTKEDTEKTEKVLNYKNENPNATQREIADATGVSVGKVNKVLNKITLDSNTNTDTSSISSSNTTSEREHEHDSQEEAVAKKETEKKRDRDLEELSDEELKSIKDDFKKRIDYKVTRERLGLNRQVSKETSKEIDTILAQREKIAHDNKIEAQFASMSNDDISKIAEYLDIDINEVPKTLSIMDCDADYFLKWIDCEHGQAFDKAEGIWKRNHELYGSYIEFVAMGVKANPIGSSWDNFC